MFSDYTKNFIKIREIYFVYSDSHFCLIFPNSKNDFLKKIMMLKVVKIISAVKELFYYCWKERGKNYVIILKSSNLFSIWVFQLLALFIPKKQYSMIFLEWKNSWEHISKYRDDFSYLKTDSETSWYVIFYTKIWDLTSSILAST